MSARSSQTAASTLSHASSAVVPCFWLQIDVKLEKFAYDYLRLNMVTIPRVAFIVGIVSLVAGIALPIAVALCAHYRQKR